MKVSAKEGGKSKFPLIPEGVHMATSWAVVDLGHQRDVWQGEIKLQHKLLIIWELHDEQVEIDGEKKPRVISSRYTASIGEKANLRKLLESWRGRAFTDEELKSFDMKNVLGKPCMLQVLHKKGNDKTSAVVATAMALPKGTKAPKAELTPIWFSLDEIDKSNPTIPEDLPEWIVNIIKESEEWKSYAVPEATEQEETFEQASSDAVPF